MTSSVSFIDEGSRRSPTTPTSTEKSRSTGSSRQQQANSSSDRYSRSQSLGRHEPRDYRGENDRSIEERYGRGGYDGEGMTISDFFRYGGRSNSRHANYASRSQSLGRFDPERDDRARRAQYYDERDFERYPPREYYMDRYPREDNYDRFGRDYYGDRNSRDSTRPFDERSYYSSDRFGSTIGCHSNERYGSDKLGSDKYMSDRPGSDRFASDRMGSDRMGSDRMGSDRFYPDRFSRNDQFLGDRVYFDRYGKY